MRERSDQHHLTGAQAALSSGRVPLPRPQHEVPSSRHLKLICSVRVRRRATIRRRSDEPAGDDSRCARVRRGGEQRAPSLTRATGWKDKRPRRQVMRCMTSSRHAGTAWCWPMGRWVPSCSGLACRRANREMPGTWRTRIGSRRSSAPTWRQAASSLSRTRSGRTPGSWPATAWRTGWRNSTPLPRPSPGAQPVQTASSSVTSGRSAGC